MGASAEVSRTEAFRWENGAMVGLGKFLSFYYRNRMEIHHQALVNSAKGLVVKFNKKAFVERERILRRLQMLAVHENMGGD